MLNSLICSKCDASFVAENQEQKERKICGVCNSPQEQEKAPRELGNGLKEGSDIGGEM